MELIAVESSHVAAIGYLETDRVLLVRYRDGSLYAQLNVSPEEFAALQSAPSKGQWLYTRDRKGVNPVCISKGVMPSDREDNPGPNKSVDRPGGNAAPPSGPLNVIDEEADKCCRRNAPKSQLWKRTDDRAAWECPECGTRFEIAAVSEGMRYWRIVPQVVIVRPR